MQNIWFRSKRKVLKKWQINYSEVSTRLILIKYNEGDKKNVF